MKESSRIKFIWMFCIIIIVLFYSIVFSLFGFNSVVNDVKSGFLYSVRVFDFGSNGMTGNVIFESNSSLNSSEVYIDPNDDAYIESKDFVATVKDVSFDDLSNESFVNDTYVELVINESNVSVNLSLNNDTLNLTKEFMSDDEIRAYFERLESIPKADKFNADSTFFDNLSLTDMESLSNVVLEIARYGSISWKNSVNVIKQDFDSNVIIDNNFVSVNVDNLDNSFNSSATIVLKNLRLVKPVIFRNGNFCSDCVIKSYVDGDLIFDVNHFSNYTSVESSSFEIYDDSEFFIVKPNESIRFYAKYLDISDNSSIVADCKFRDNFGGSFGSYEPMIFDSLSNSYVIDKSYSDEGSFNFEVSCSNDLGYKNYTLVDDFNIVLTSHCDYFLSDCKQSGWESNSVYCMDKSIDFFENSSCMVFDFDNVTLDCLNLAFEGNFDTFGVGVYIDDKTNIKLKSCRISGFDRGLYIVNSSNILLDDLDVYDNSFYGLFSDLSNVDYKSSHFVNNPKGDLHIVGEFRTFNKVH